MWWINFIIDYFMLEYDIREPADVTIILDMSQIFLYLA